MSDEREDFIAYFGTDPFRPRDEFDVDVEPESLRGKALAVMDRVDEAHTKVVVAVNAMPWYQRWPIRAYGRIRGVRL